MNQVLFVDDEQAVLDGLENLLRRQRHVWGLHFALGATTALSLLEAKPFDVIVTDMRMPGFDGAQLLTRVKAKWPTTVRVVLSGHADRESLARALPVAHQFLSKPCDAGTIEGVLSRTFSLAALLKNEQLRAVVGSLDNLPSPPDLYWDLQHVMADPSSGLDAVASLVETDPAMSLKVLQLVNSVAFGAGRPIASTKEAVRYLGVELLRAYALSASLFSSLSAAEVQRHSLATAHLARAFLKGSPRADEAFTAAMLQDFGKLVLRQAQPDRAKRAYASGGPTGEALVALELELFGATHAAVGGYLAAVWGLPLSIVEAITHHHEPGVLVGADPLVLAAVHVAGALAQPGGGEVDLAFLRRAGLLERLSRWQALAAEAHQKEAA
ncbi:MAG: HDOD domain-containing protein [Myxococcales bacterium]|nr:HDOD domain-containing protein [Myxococcales bacterium]